MIQLGDDYYNYYYKPLVEQLEELAERIEALEAKAREGDEGDSMGDSPLFSRTVTGGVA